MKLSVTQWQAIRIQHHLCDIPDKMYGLNLIIVKHETNANQGTQYKVIGL